MPISKRIEPKRNRILIYGSGTLAMLLAIFGSINYLDVNVTTSGDIQCAGTMEEPCISYFNITLGQYAILFGNTFGGIYLSDENTTYKIQKADLRYRSDNPNRWKDFNFTRGTSLKNATTHEFRLIGYKNIDKNVKWGVSYGIKNVDPIWSGYNASSFLQNVSITRQDLNGGSFEFTLYNPTSFDIPVGKYLSSRIEKLTNDNADVNIFIKTNTTLTYRNQIGQTSNYVNTTHYIPSNETFTGRWEYSGYENITPIYETKTEYPVSYLPIANFTTLKKKQSVTIRIDASWNFALNKTIKVDVIPRINISNTIFERADWIILSADYLNYRYVDIGNMNVTGALKKGNQINFTMDTSSMNILANGNDFRIAFNDGSANWKEINRTNFTSFKQTDTRIGFLLQDAMAPNILNTSNYAIVYNYASATAPSAYGTQTSMFPDATEKNYTAVWRMQELGGNLINNATLGNVNAIKAGSPIYGVTPDGQNGNMISGKSIGFTTGNYFTYSPLGMGGNWTTCFWAKPDVINTGSDNGDVISLGGFRITITRYSGAGIYPGEWQISESGNNWDSANNPGAIIGAWQYLCFQRDTSGLEKIWVNGTFANSRTTGNTGIQGETWTPWIADGDGASGSDWRGNITDITIMKDTYPMPTPPSPIFPAPNITINSEQSNVGAGPPYQSPSFCDQFFDHPVSPSGYSGNISMQTSCNLGTQNTTMEFNGINYTKNSAPFTYNKTAGIFQFNLTSRTSGTYNYRWISFNNNTNNGTATRSITIDKANPSSGMNLYIDNVLSNKTVTYPTTITAKGNDTNTGDSDLVFNLTRDNIIKSNPETIELGVGSYTYRFNTTAGANYTIGNATIRGVTINIGAGGAIYIFLNGTNTTNSYQYYEDGSGVNLTTQGSGSNVIYLDYTDLKGFGRNFTTGVGSITNQSFASGSLTRYFVNTSDNDGREYYVRNFTSTGGWIASTAITDPSFEIGNLLAWNKFTGMGYFENSTKWATDGSKSMNFVCGYQSGNIPCMVTLSKSVDTSSMTIKKFIVDFRNNASSASQFKVTVNNDTLFHIAPGATELNKEIDLSPYSGTVTLNITYDSPGNDVFANFHNGLVDNIREYVIGSMSFMVEADKRWNPNYATMSLRGIKGEDYPVNLVMDTDSNGINDIELVGRLQDKELNLTYFGGNPSTTTDYMNFTGGGTKIKYLKITNGINISTAVLFAKASVNASAPSNVNASAYITNAGFEILTNSYDPPYFPPTPLTGAGTLQGWDYVYKKVYSGDTAGIGNTTGEGKTEGSYAGYLAAGGNLAQVRINQSINGANLPGDNQHKLIFFDFMIRQGSGPGTINYGTCKIWVDSTEVFSQNCADYSTTNYMINVTSATKRIGFGIDDAVGLSVTYTRFIIDNIRTTGGGAYNFTLDTGNDGIIDSNIPLLSDTSYTAIDMNKTAISSFLNKSCDKGITCNVTLKFGLTASSNVDIKGIDVRYTKNSSYYDFNASALRVKLNNMNTNFTNISFSFLTQSINTSTIELSNLDIKFRGSKNYSIGAYSLGNVNQTGAVGNATLAVVYSEFNKSLPYTFTNTIVFSPDSNNSKNITPYGQTSIRPIYNFTPLAYDKNFYIGMGIGSAINSCLNMTFSNTSSKDGGQRFNSSSALSPADMVFNMALGGQTKGVWMWNDYYQCNGTAQAYFRYNYTARSCCTICARCW